MIERRRHKKGDKIYNMDYYFVKNVIFSYYFCVLLQCFLLGIDKKTDKNNNLDFNFVKNISIWQFVCVNQNS